jgi:hypothetical protein
MIVAVLVVLGGGWVLVVSPERKQASKLQSEVNTAQSQLQAAESTLANARSAQSRYSAAYSSIVKLGKAVPPGREVPSLVYELARASSQKHVDLSSIVYGASGGASGSGSSAQTAGSTVGGFTQMPFTFVFNGNFNDLYNLFQQLNHYTVRTHSGTINVTGRLLTIQGAKLAPLLVGGESSSGIQLSGTINATAYVLPATQGLTGGASPSSPSSSSATPASASGGAGSPVAPAVVRAAP